MLNRPWNVGGFNFLNIHQQYAEICPVYILNICFLFCVLAD